MPEPLGPTLVAPLITDIFAQMLRVELEEVLHLGRKYFFMTVLRILCCDMEIVVLQKFVQVRGNRFDSNTASMGI